MRIDRSGTHHFHLIMGWAELRIEFHFLWKWSIFILPLSLSLSLTIALTLTLRCLPFPLWWTPKPNFCLPRIVWLLKFWLASPSLLCCWIGCCLERKSSTWCWPCFFAFIFLHCRILNPQVLSFLSILNSYFCFSSPLRLPKALAGSCFLLRFLFSSSASCSVLLTNRKTLGEGKKCWVPNEFSSPGSWLLESWLPW